MTSWWYWIAFAAVAVACLAGPWACSKLEERADRKNAERWARMSGATR